MKNLLNKEDLLETLERIDQLTPETLSLWGKMNVNQMLCHAADQMKMMYGDIPTKDESNFLSRTILKSLALKKDDLPKDLPTLMEINQIEGKGTPTTNFEADKKTLKGLLLDVPMKKNYDLVPHPKFGKMNTDQFGRMSYQHIDHHLKQFGV